MTLAFLLAAVVCICVSVALNEAIFRFRMIKKKRFLLNLSDLKTAETPDSSINSDRLGDRV